ncbi:replication factor C subunit 5-like isoform X1 [Varroa jacobsoni]|uniref:Activator 1 subunit 5 n=1 Tax=Varroa destructor TaxID=109461 RepID=A0A7M7KMF0_VARDE|nr:replication factor C subunit 5-like [Varroa destructor]XP_022703236.1 replication factor C subunit 5-like isoform X1 [Varroa jacobsoni]
MAAPDVNNLPWVEKYRPKTLQDLIAHEDIIATIDRFVSQDKFPHLLFYGPPGTGKTSTILATAHRLYSPTEFNSMVLELNASDDRGIGIVRGEILNFASTRTVFNKRFKLIILDEADAMTQDAQNALRRVIEKYTDNARFCIICNYLSKIIPPLQSRCTRFRFGPLSIEQMVPRIKHVIAEESVKISSTGIDAIIELSEGDMRKSLNILQSAFMAFASKNEVITEDEVYQCVGAPQKSTIAEIMGTLMNDDVTTAYNKVLSIKQGKGLSMQDIVGRVHLFIASLDLKSQVKVFIFSKLGEVEKRLTVGTSENIQLASLVALIFQARQLM